MPGPQDIPQDIPSRDTPSLENPGLDMEQVQKILDCLKKHMPKDLSIDEIAEHAGIHRNTVSKYVYALEGLGQIKMTRRIGAAKMFTLGKACKGNPGETG